MKQRTRSDISQTGTGGIRVDSFGLAHIVRTESLTAICLLILAACGLGFILWSLQTILVPFAISIFLMHLLQPIVNILSRPPRRWYVT
jgi:predicted PurR-regulated permease PerM